MSKDENGWQAANALNAPVWGAFIRTPSCHYAHGMSIAKERVFSVKVIKETLNKPPRYFPVEMN
jgi:coenzyme F420-reducing hydrogenase delta subunit